jgi:GNAT superfamily N-acetyltransferase
MRLGLDALQAPGSLSAMRIAPIGARPARDLAELLLDAYRGGPDEEEHTLDEAEAEVLRTVQGSYGPLVPDASLVASDDLGPCAASLVVRHKGSILLAHALTHPRCAGRGLGSSLIVQSCHLLKAMGEREVLLAVNPANLRAIKLYERLGFVHACWQCRLACRRSCRHRCRSLADKYCPPR